MYVKKIHQQRVNLPKFYFFKLILPELMEDEHTPILF